MPETPPIFSLVHSVALSTQTSQVARLGVSTITGDPDTIFPFMTVTEAGS
jgi:hypothetical protein